MSPQPAFSGDPPTSVESGPKDPRRTSVAAQGLRMPDGIVVIRWWAGFASLGAGIIHLAAVGEHGAEWWLYGVFFMVLAVVQIAWAVQAMDTHHPLPVPSLYAMGNAAVVGLWFVSRTTGLPVGPERWAAETVGTADLLSTALEVVVVVLLVLTLRRHQDQESRSLTKPQRRMVAVGAVAVAAVTGVAVAANPPSILHPSHGHGVHSAGVIPTPANSTASGE
jgi:hypothetical protein